MSEHAHPAQESEDRTLEADVFARDCASRETLQTVTGRWGVLALAALTEGSYRFSALRRRVDGVSERMLSQTLQALERDGLVIREVLEAIPPKVEYSLTPLGAEIGSRLIGLIELVESRVPDVLAAQERYDAGRGVS
ncbi:MULTISPECIES: helix-turn-helix domain-containing protein [unclassified Rhodococcus (in: high G+C Gram-positive bacteria)]|uniref:winged helix-turn-helix transcriptional regulator n=1 Tax=unclassified Rhodococcus (in: high G+C Gram-positive bacteria) TaxID=192944 RepID=UPI00163AA49B|nr:MULTISPECIES: helix-turn-helix domain-containing protein [unclassified Rhodococcus (in: high G+C Gram-positive bacteria)]MBC2639536.1 helix-turn-helix transcriptional regulator [Rhodococcus sp. 3A]MBC2895719.1 helix-turn-helix transcriptional regulator [Rhodococcus sp. 4CII]